MVPLDPAYVPPPCWSIFDAAVDAIRGGQGYEDADPTSPRFGSVDGERHLCGRCTVRHDESGTAPPSVSQPPA